MIRDLGLRDLRSWIPGIVVPALVPLVMLALILVFGGEGA